MTEDEYRNAWERLAYDEGHRRRLPGNPAKINGLPTVVDARRCAEAGMTAAEAAAHLGAKANTMHNMAKRNNFSFKPGRNFRH